jgi:hypothetical protein
MRSFDFSGQNLVISHGLSMELVLLRVSDSLLVCRRKVVVAKALRSPVALHPGSPSRGNRFVLGPHRPHVMILESLELILILVIGRIAFMRLLLIVIFCLLGFNFRLFLC